MKEQNGIREIEMDVQEIEINLKREDYDKAIQRIRELKDGHPDYSSHEDGYLVDFFLGQALFRQEMSGNAPSIEKIDEAIAHYQDSLRLREDHAGCHLLIGWAYMIKASLAKERDVSNNMALYHLKRAKNLDPSFTKRCDKHILLIGGL